MPYVGLFPSFPDSFNIMLKVEDDAEFLFDINMRQVDIVGCE